VRDYAAKVGLGVGTEQDYARAGELCRAAGVDDQKQLSAAALGRVWVYNYPTNGK
jgi:hypothetical protein